MDFSSRNLSHPLLKASRIDVRLAFKFFLNYVWLSILAWSYPIVSDLIQEYVITRDLTKGLSWFALWINTHWGLEERHLLGFLGSVSQVKDKPRSSEQVLNLDFFPGKWIAFSNSLSRKWMGTSYHCGSSRALWLIEQWPRISSNSNLKPPINTLVGP